MKKYKRLIEADNKNLVNAFKARFKFHSLGLDEFLEKNKDSIFLGKNRENAIKYNRTKFNNLRGSSQQDYIQNINKEKFTFSLYYSNSNSFDIPEYIFNYVKEKYPKIKVKDFNFYVDYSSMLD
jgi:hypothetical protein